MREPEYCDDKRLERRFEAVLVVSGGQKSLSEFDKNATNACIFVINARSYFADD